MPELDVWNVVGNRVLTLGRLQDLRRRDEQEVRFRVDEARDQPRTRDSVNTRTLTSHPLHESSPWFTSIVTSLGATISRQARVRGDSVIEFDLRPPATRASLLVHD